MQTETTNNITVSIEPTFLDEQSEPEERHFVWAYHVRIENRSRNSVQLKTRHWNIADSTGFVRRIDGPGVVGEQPVLKPGDIYEYTSGTPLTSPSGIMGGRYGMCDELGREFSIVVPACSLDSPHESRRVH